MIAGKKLGFWTLFAIITGSQIGSGALLLPSKLAQYGYYSLYGWIVSAFGSIALALVFARLSATKKQKGGPHAFVIDSLGISSSYFVGWTYWIISWASMTAVLSACAGYLAVFFQISHASYQAFFIELAILATVFAVNWFGVSVAGKVELILTIVKFVPLALIPLFCFFALDQNLIRENFLQSPQTEAPFFSLISQIILLTLWGFIGFETGTAPAEEIHEPRKTIPRAIVISTIVVAVVYIFNNVSLGSFVPRSELGVSEAPYALATERLFGGHFWSGVISLISAIVCLGTFNAWILASTQIALNIRRLNFTPEWLGMKNKHGIPKYALITSTVGIFIILLFLRNQTYGDKLTHAVTYAVTSFLVIYLVCCFGALVDHFKKNSILKPFEFFYHVVAFLFCFWILWKNPLMNTVYALTVPLTGVPFYLFKRSQFQKVPLPVQE